MSEVSMKGMEMTRMLDKMRAMEGKGNDLSLEKPTTSQQSFSSILEQAIDKVNELQETSEQLKTSYEIGDRNISLSQVMVASQKANLSFQAILQVRNKLVSAYKEVMNMPV